MVIFGEFWWRKRKGWVVVVRRRGGFGLILAKFSLEEVDGCGG